MKRTKAYSHHAAFSLKQLFRATRKPPWCSETRWRMELSRRRASGMGRPKKTKTEKEK